MYNHENANAHVRDGRKNDERIKKAVEELVNQCITSGFPLDLIKDGFASFDGTSTVNEYGEEEEETFQMLDMVYEYATVKGFSKNSECKAFWVLFQDCFINGEYNFDVDGLVVTPYHLLVSTYPECDFTKLPNQIKSVPTQFITYPTSEADGACVACPSTRWTPEKVKDFYGYKINGDLRFVHSVFRLFDKNNDSVADFYDKDSAVKYAESEKENGLGNYTILEIFR